MNMQNPTIVRLNAVTSPMIPGERRVLDAIKANVVEIEGAEDAEIMSAAGTADAVMIISAYLKAEVIRGLTRCRIISRLGTGVDKIDIEQATRQGIFVTNLPDAFTEEVADHTLALLLAAARRLKFLDAQMRLGRQPRDLRGIHRLSTRTLGIIGFGRIGRAVAVRAKAFGMKIMVFDPALSGDDAQQLGVQAAERDTVLAEADYLCLLCPLLPSTRKMLGADQFAKMKPGAVLINTGRGGLVDEIALVEALRRKRIRYAALDVFEEINVFAPHGFAVDHPFFGLDNVLLTPHAAAYSEEAASATCIRGAQAVVDVLSGRRPQYPVNPQVKPWFPL